MVLTFGGKNLESTVSARKIKNNLQEMLLKMNFSKNEFFTFNCLGGIQIAEVAAKTTAKFLTDTVTKTRSELYDLYRSFTRGSGQLPHFWKFFFNETKGISNQVN